MSTGTATFTSFEKDKFRKNKTYVLNSMNMKPTVEGVQFPVSAHFAAISDIYDSVKDEMRIIRYIPGEKSIYKDEQSPDDKIPKKRQTLTFVKGFLHVDPREKQLISYIEKCNENGSNVDRKGEGKPLFYELIMGNAAKQMNDATKKTLAATSWVYSAPVMDVINYANILSITTEGREFDEIQWDMKTAAERDPIKFLEGFNNPSTKRKFDIINAIKKGILIKNQNVITWAVGGVICVTPAGRTPEDFLVEKTFSDKDGEVLYLAICEALRPKAPKEEKVSHKPLKSDGKDELDILIEMSVERGIVTKKAQWFVYGDKKQIGKAWKAFLKENPEVVSEINDKMKAALA